MMNQQKSLIRISEFLSRFKIQTSILNSNAQLDINIVAEDVLIPILNIAYSCNLTNAKYSERDAAFPALDLLDKENRVAFQITATSKIGKIKDTLEKIISNNFFISFDAFFIYIITEKQNKYDKNVLTKATNGLFTFSNSNIIDEKDLYQKIASLPYESIKKVENLLEDQFSDQFKDESKIQNDLSKIISKMKFSNNDHFVLLELEGYYEVRELLLNKKFFFEKNLIITSDASKIFTLNFEIEGINKKLKECNENIIKIIENSK